MSALRLVAALAVLVFGCDIPRERPGPSVEIKPTAIAESVGNYHLSFEVNSTVVAAGSPVTGEALLWTDSSTSTPVSGSGAGLIAFRFSNGDTTVVPAWTADCHSYSLSADQPFSSGITKSGSFSETDPQAPFFREFFSTPDVILPAGSWSISAIANFHEGPACEGSLREIVATVDVVSR